MPNIEVFNDDFSKLEVRRGEAGSVTVSMKSVDMESPILISLGSNDVNELIKTLSSLSDETSSIVSIK